MKKSSKKGRKKKVEKPLFPVPKSEVKRDVKRSTKRVIALTKKQVLGIVFGIVILLVVFLVMSMGSTPVPDDVIATVNGEFITQSEIDQSFEQLSQQNPAITEEEILDQLVAKYLILSEAKAQGIAVANEDIESYLTNVEASFQQDLDVALEQLGITREELEKQVREQLMITQLLLSQTGMEDTELTEEELQTFYEENKNELQVGEQVEASHILVETEDEAEDILDELATGTDFNDLAFEKSIDPSAKSNRGNLGSFQRGQMVAEFEEVAFAASIGAVAGPVKTQFGYHIILVHNKEAAKTLSFEEVKENIKNVLLQQRQQEKLAEYIEELRAKAKIEYL